MSALPLEPEPIHIGFTGTRHALGALQGVALLAEMRAISLTNWPATIVGHHGCCTGADESFHFAGLRLDWLLRGHPCINPAGVAPHRSVRTRRSDFESLDNPAPYAARNRTIVSWAHRLIACPAYAENAPQSDRSGTWQTVRIARDQLVPVTVIMPDGSVIR